MDGDSRQHTLLRTLSHDLEGMTQLQQAYDKWLKTLSPKLLFKTPMSHRLSDPYVHVARSTNKYESTQTRAKAEADLSEYLEIINIHNNDPFIEKFHRFLVYACIRTRLLVISRRFLSKGLKDIQESDLVALIEGVNMPMIIWKKGSSYRSKGPAYIHSMMYSKMWPEGEKDLINIILSEGSLVCITLMA
jgi:hypothetical protein